MNSFNDLINSRKAWIEEILKPWCRQATRRDLLLAEQEWTDIAGRAAPEMTLWLWAWGRFPVLCVDGLNTISETVEVRVTTTAGKTLCGYPDGRQSQRGTLVLIDTCGNSTEPVVLDDIATVETTEAV